ncbi:sensor histidine kinase [Vallitalea pronyensis]|uniref:histidine kinase n=1 Tax=Vallitalea pronyensis TaxID=1348613 RepID=A0A8J8MKD6_9FIRM|nr:sensor histidine kinase [Vallitalea pronyensis]QUI23315.1 sensor histidine kinase [Vallitalea pronyensis]
MIICLMIIIVLIITNYLQHCSLKAKNKHLNYMQKKIEMIMLNNTNENLLILTNDRHLKPLLIEINKLLAYSQSSMVNSVKSQRSMKKMLSNISHDIKTPLTVILGYMEILTMNNEISHQERERLLLKVKQKTEDLIQLIHTFFDLAKLESGDTNIQLKRVNVNEICKKNILGFYEILLNQHIDVNIDIPDEPLYILGNEEALNRILNNLISNAIKYGLDGKIIGLQLEAVDDNVFIHIWDKGRGIGETHINQVFDRLYTLEDSRNKHYQGSGLGLTITKKLVENMNGDILIESKPYERTCVTMTFNRVVY